MKVEEVNLINKVLNSIEDKNQRILTLSVSKAGIDSLQNYDKSKSEFNDLKKQFDELYDTYRKVAIILTTKQYISDEAKTIITNSFNDLNFNKV